MAKVQDGAGSSKDDGFKDNSTHPQPTKTDIPKNDEQDPKSTSPGEDGLEDFFDARDLPVDMNAADVKKLMNEYLARMSKGLRT
jgi:hypothetical protein